jgi:hypothetical protein
MVFLPLSHFQLFFFCNSSYQLADFLKFSLIFSQGFCLKFEGKDNLVGDGSVRKFWGIAKVKNNATKQSSEKSKPLDTRLAKLQLARKETRNKIFQTENEQNIGNVQWPLIPHCAVKHFRLAMFCSFSKEPNWTKTEASGRFPALLFL